MPILTRRRLQKMLDDLSHLTDLEKLGEIHPRLVNKRVGQALPAELELGVLWALSRLGDLEIEPKGYGDDRPDAYTEHLFAPNPCIVEVTAISDARDSQQDEMQRIASGLCDYANSVRRGHGKHLYFTFGEESGHRAAGYVRRRRIDPGFVPDETTKAAMRQWLEQEDRSTPLAIGQGRTHLVVGWREQRQHSMSNFFCSMPAEAFSLEDNPLFDAMNEKRKQLRAPGFNGLRCIVVADAGSRMLRDLNPIMRSMGSVTGVDVIKHFLQWAGGAVDAVIVLSAGRAPNPHYHASASLMWYADLFVRPGLALDGGGVDRLVSHLPAPRFEGYQARSLQQQQAFRPDRHGWWLGTHINESGSIMTIKISARALLDLLAGRITVEHFQRSTGLLDSSTQKNIFAQLLDQGETFAGIEIEPGGIDEDDDWLTIRFKHDAAAAPLSVNAPDKSRSAD